MSASQQLPEDPKLRALYQAGRDEQPSETLDRSVLTQARHAAARRRKRWVVPLSSAALLLLGVSLTLPLIEPPEPLYESEPASPADYEKRLLQEPDRSLQKSAPSQAPAGLRLSPPPSREALEQRESATAEIDEAAAPAPALRARKRAQAESLGEASREDPQPLAQEDAGLTPQAWLERIEQLISADRQQAATESLAEFRTRYPDYPLPESVQQWLERQ